MSCSSSAVPDIRFPREFSVKMAPTFNEKYQKKLQDWLELDDYIESRNAKLKVAKDKKKELEQQILSYVEEGELQNVNVELEDGKIEFKEDDTKSSFTMKYLKDMIYKYFNDTRHATANDLFEFLVQNRHVKTKLVMKRTFSKS